MCYCSHGYEDGQNIHPETEVGDPTKISQGSDLAQDETDDGENQGTNNVADTISGHFGDVLTEENNHLTEQ